MQLYVSDNFKYNKLKTQTSASGAQIEYITLLLFLK